MSAAAIEALRELRAAPGFDEAAFIRDQVATFAHLYGLTRAEAGEIVRSTRLADRSRYDWLAGITQAAGRGTITLKAVLVGAALFQRFNDASPYCWPSQQSLASAIGWTSKRGVLHGLAQLEAIGAIERIAARNLPPEIAHKVFSSREEGGSGRDPRAMAYKRINVDMWQSSNRCPDRPPIWVSDPVTLNHKGKPQRLRRDSSFTECSSSESLMTAATSQNLNDGVNERQVANG